MKILLYISTIILWISCTTKQKYNLRFDYNLKGSPKSIDEYEMFSIADIYDNDSLKLIDSSLNSLIKISKYRFDTLGNKIEYYHKDFLDTSAKLFTQENDTSLTRTKYKDSLIISSKYFNWHQKLLFDKNGLLMSDIMLEPMIDSTEYIRNKDGIIIGKKKISYGRDTKNWTTYRYKTNKSGDIIEEFIHKKFYYANGNKMEVSEDSLQYGYIYDDYNNWIIKTTKQNGIIKKITQRKIVY